jgi:hypothetical protein
MAASLTVTESSSATTAEDIAFVDPTIKKSSVATSSVLILGSAEVEVEAAASSGPPLDLL